MNELVRDELIRIVRENSEDVLLDPVRTKAFLNDFCGNKYRREINSITLALKEGAATELLNSRRNRTERFAIARLSKNLEESFGFPRQQTIWTVESIAIALGIIESDSIKTSVKDTEKESEGRHSSVETASSTQTNLVVDERKEAQIDESSYARSDNTAKTKPDREMLTPKVADESKEDQGSEAKPEEARSPQFIQDEEKASGPTIKVKKKRVALPLLSMLSLLLIILFIIISGNSQNKPPNTPSNTIYSPNSKVSEGTVLVEKGSFTMGDTLKVTLTYNFYIGKYETTFDEYDAFCEATGRSKPSDRGWGRGSNPVINVSWNDAIAYCNWLSEKEKLPKAYDSKGNLLDKDGRVTTDPSKVVGYRLPTEAEWEFAARGGIKSSGFEYSGSDNVDDVAWYDSNSGGKTQEVGKKAPNELGIYDMSGNVWEWCSDWYGSYSSSAQTNPYNNSGSGRVLLGGSWLYEASYARVASRLSYSPTFTYNNLGFRIARTVH